jgi:hypothetical protein
VSDSSTRPPPADDAFHPVLSEDPAWVETVWFPFWIPDRHITVYVRLVFQPNAGVYSASVSAWSGADHSLFRHAWQQPLRTLDELGDLRDLRLDQGLTLRALEPLQRYAVEFSHAGCEIDVVFEALMPPDAPSPDDSPGMFAGHLDQPGRVTGRLRLGEQHLSVDRWSVRDRSWGPRVAAKQLRIGNAHATRKDRAFFSYIKPDGRGGEMVRGGYHLCDGEVTQLVSGSRETEWDGDWPAALVIRARDDRGRDIVARGTCVNRSAVAAGSDLYAVLNLVRWELDQTTLWGENHDVWSKRAWLDAGRAALD